MALIHDDEIEKLRRQRPIVGNLRRSLLLPAAHSIEQRFLFQRRIEFRFAAQHRVQALDGGDTNVADRVQHVRRHALNVVQLGELAAIVGRGVLLEFVVRLPT